MNINFPIGYINELVWWPQLRMGWHPMPPCDYSTDYWEDYLEKDRTPMAEKLTQARIDLVLRHYQEKDLIDIGIGGGKFVSTHDCFGYDINPRAKQWLEDKSKWKDPYQDPPAAICCWDSLEHIPQPELLVKQARQWIFVSLPVFENGDAVLKSKHYKPGEHIWYWSTPGLIAWFEKQGFVLREHNQEETMLGRDGIDSFAFQRSSK